MFFWFSRYQYNYYNKLRDSNVFLYYTLTDMNIVGTVCAWFTICGTQLWNSLCGTPVKGTHKNHDPFATYCILFINILAEDRKTVRGVWRESTHFRQIKEERKLLARGGDFYGHLLSPLLSLFVCFPERSWKIGYGVMPLSQLCSSAQ